MLPFYIYYSMFGFQRVGDAIWAAADQRARGFLLGATSGRTTLAGEGLQHQDGSSHLVAATIPNCKAYDPALAGEMAVLVDHGMREMLVEQRDVFYYVTLMNQNYAQPDLPASAREGVLKGGYVFDRFGPVDGTPVTLLGSGAILTEVLHAAEQLAQDGQRVHVCSITSWSELAREAQAAEADGRFEPALRIGEIAVDEREPSEVVGRLGRAGCEGGRGLEFPARRGDLVVLVVEGAHEVMHMGPGRGRVDERNGCQHEHREKNQHRDDGRPTPAPQRPPGPPRPEARRPRPPPGRPSGSRSGPGGARRDLR